MNHQLLDCYSIGRHFDHAQDRTVKGINVVTVLYHSQAVALAVSRHLVAKTEHYVDTKDGKIKRRSPISKNDVYRV